MENSTVKVFITLAIAALLITDVDSLIFSTQDKPITQNLLNQPDLIVSQINYLVEKPGFFGNRTVTITAKIQNLRNATAGNSTTEIKITDGVPPVLLIKNAPTPPIIGFGSANVSAVFMLPPGTYNATITADINNEVNESSESNNQAGNNTIFVT
ncbi:hypothetical protein HY450_04130 [Candidatus Pacearchaeota archaeon]|nr:hypothetical protein [Candidatus Pacearchaeota archaeon]